MIQPTLFPQILNKPLLPCVGNQSARVISRTMRSS